MNGLGKMRKRAKLTQAQASKAANIALGTLRNWEQGLCEPDARSLVALSYLYNCTTDDLLESSFAGMPQRRNHPPKDVGDPRERELREIWVALSEEGRNALIATARGLLSAYPGETSSDGMSASA